MINAYNPYTYDTAPPAQQFSAATNNLFYFDSTATHVPSTCEQGRYGHIAESDNAR
jgi:hypothetical protein